MGTIYADATTSNLVGSHHSRRRRCGQSTLQCRPRIPGEDSANHRQAIRLPRQLPCSADHTHHLHDLVISPDPPAIERLGDGEREAWSQWLYSLSLLLVVVLQRNHPCKVALAPKPGYGGRHMGAAYFIWPRRWMDNDGLA